MFIQGQLSGVEKRLANGRFHFFGATKTVFQNQSRFQSEEKKRFAKGRGVFALEGTPRRSIIDLISFSWRLSPCRSPV